MMTGTEGETLRLVLAARLSKKVDKYQGLGIETQDQYGREWAERQHNFTTKYGTYRNVKVIAVAADIKSGRVPPWGRKNLKPWITRRDLMDRYDGILAYRNNRLSRGDPEDEWKIRQWATNNGKVLVIVDGPQWPPRNDGDFWQWTALAKAAEDEWKEIQERNIRQQAELRRRGMLVGRCPWGYVSFGEKYNKIIVPTDDGRKFIGPIFQRKADGDSLMVIARWLDAQGAKPKYGNSWSPKSVANIIRNRTYMGMHLDQRGRLLLRVEALVNAKLWRQANDSLTNAPRGRRGPSNGETAFLTGFLFCPRCPRDGKHAPMYRVNSRNRGYRYRCAGHLPQRKGCGNSVELENADVAVINILSLAPDPWKELRLVPGENHDRELAGIRLELDDLSKRNLSDAEEDSERARLRAERDRLESLPNVPDHWEEVDTGKTVGEHFASLHREGRRAMLLDDVTVYAQSITDPELRKLTPGPMLRIESRLFKLPITWMNEAKERLAP